MAFKQPNLFKRSFGFLFLTFVLAYSTLWYVECLFFETILEKMIKAGHRQGIHLTYADIETGGFPEKLTLTLNQVRFRSKEVKINVPSICVEASLFFPFKGQFDLRVEDTPRFSFQGYHGKGSQLRGRILLEKFRFKGIAIDIDTLLLLRKKMPILNLSKGHMNAYLTQPFEQSPNLQVTFRGQIESWFKDLALQANRIFRIESRLSISHVDALFEKNKGIEVWKNEKGSLQIHGLSFIFPRMDLSFEGRLYVDDKQALSGDFNLSMKGFQRVLDLLSKYGVSQKDLSFLRLSLIFLKKNQDGSLSLPFKFRENRFYVMGLALPFSLKDILD